MKKVCLSLTILCSLSCGSLLSQDLMPMSISQSLISINPSFAGNNGMVRNQFYYRQLYPSLAKDYYMLSNNADVFIKPLHAGVGVSVTHANWGSYYKGSTYGINYAQYF